MAEIRYNNSLGQLGAPMGSTDTSITFTGSPGWATLTGGDFIKLELDPPTSTNPVPNPLFEVVYVTAYTGSSSTATISRGEEGTTPVDHAVNATWINGPTAADDVAAVTSVFGRSGDVLAESGDYDVAEVTGAAPLAGPTFTGDVTLASGSLDVASAGEGLAVAEGSNAKQGTVTLVAGTAVVANTSVTATSRIFLTCQSLGTVTVPSGYGVSARTPGTSFTILASAPTDTSVIAYELFEVG